MPADWKIHLIRFKRAVRQNVLARLDGSKESRTCRKCRRAREQTMHFHSYRIEMAVPRVTQLLSVNTICALKEKPRTPSRDMMPKFQLPPL